MRIIFMGSAQFACPSLVSLLAAKRYEVVGAVTQPERPSGRRLQVAKCPVHSLLATGAVPVLTPANVNAPESIAALRALHPDLVVVVAYGQLLGTAVLEMAPLGCVNLHASLLPKYRGAAPIQWAIASGDTVTGVTTMFLNLKMDEGDIIARDVEQIDENDTSATLAARLAERGARLLLDTVELIRRGTAPRLPQDNALATYAPRLRKEDGRLDWAKNAAELANRVRAFQPWPGCYCVCGKTTLAVLKARAESGSGAPPGTVIESGGDGPLVQAADGALRLLEVKPSGGKAMSGAAFIRGHSLGPGAALD